MTIGTVVEPKTKTEFPPVLPGAGESSPEQVLMGVGVRTKRVLIKNINVYAIGLYVDKAMFQDIMASFQTTPAGELESSQPFLDGFVKSPMDRTLRMVMTFGVSSKQFWGAMEEMLRPVMKQAGKEDKLMEFGKCFEKVDLGVGTDILMLFSGAKLTTLIRGKQRGTVESVELQQAVLRTYLGPKPVSPEAKASIVQGLAGSLTTATAAA